MNPRLLGHLGAHPLVGRRGQGQVWVVTGQSCARMPSARSCGHAWSGRWPCRKPGIPGDWVSCPHKGPSTGAWRSACRGSLAFSAGWWAQGGGRASRKRVSGRKSPRAPRQRGRPCRARLALWQKAASSCCGLWERTAQPVSCPAPSARQQVRLISVVINTHHTEFTILTF